MRLWREAPAGYHAGMGASWAGKPCARCGTTRTSNLSDGLPVCSACLKIKREEIARKDVPPRLCPVDGAPMTLDLVLGVVIDQCPTCRGVFLDKGELDVIRRASGQVAGDGGFWAMMLMLLATT